MKTFPSTKFSKVVPISNSPAYISDSQSLKSIATGSGAQRWEFELTTGWHAIPQAMALWAFLNARGQHEKFQVQVPMLDTPSGSVIGAVKALASYAVGTKDIGLVNFQALAGDFVQFSGHAKVYQIEESVNQVFTLYPPLITSVLINEAVNVNNLKFTVRGKDSKSKLSSKLKTRAKIKFKCIEAF